jgi:predicted Fe-Mo cluster-binding NifX family protein
MPEPDSVHVRVAVASGDGGFVDRHLATSPEFHIYDFDGSAWRPVEIRANLDASCACGEGLNHRSFEPLVGRLSDCQFVVAMQIGPAAAISLFREGIRAHVASGPTEQVLRDFQTTSKFTHPLPKKEMQRQ